MVSPVQTLCYAQDATIASGASLSGAVNLSGHVLVGVYMPASWTAAGLTFQGSNDGVTWANIYASDGAEVSATAAAGQYISLDSNTFLGVKYLKVRSGTSAAAVNQGAARTLVLMVGTPA